MKMKSRILAFIAIAALGFSTTSQAGVFYTANDLTKYCESEIAVENNICGGYLIAISDYHDALIDFGEITKQFCIPDSASGRQLRKVFAKYTNEYSEDLHYTASSIAHNAFRETFPCK
jgi:hypothetical protein